MVATIRNLTSSSATVEYFRHDGGYYVGSKGDAGALHAKREEHREASAWHGCGAEALGLKPGARVSARAFERLLQGHVPGTEIRLGRVRHGGYERRPGFDLTFSAPKSVSLAALLPTERHPRGDRSVVRAHDEAVRATLDWVEETFLETRGWDPETRQRPRVKAPFMAAATFRHVASRNLDPQLHTHAVIANVTRDADGRWRSVDPVALHRNARLIGAYYRDRLARKPDRARVFDRAGDGRAGFRASISRAWAVSCAMRSRRGGARSWPMWRIAAGTAARRRGRSRRLRRGVARRSRSRGCCERSGGSARSRSASERFRSRVPGKGYRFRRRRRRWRSLGRTVSRLEERYPVFAERELEALALGHSPGRHSLGEIREAVAWMVRDGHLVEAQLRGSDRSYVTDRDAEGGAAGDRGDEGGSRCGGGTGRRRRGGGAPGGRRPDSGPGGSGADGAAVARPYRGRAGLGGDRQDDDAPPRLGARGRAPGVGARAGGEGGARPGAASRA